MPLQLLSIVDAAAAPELLSASPERAHEDSPLARLYSAMGPSHGRGAS